MNAYKVFYQDPDGRLFSTNYGRNSSGLYQEYFFDRKNVPAFKYPIFAFPTYEMAVQYANPPEVIALVKGEYYGKIKMMLPVFDSYASYIDTYRFSALMRTCKEEAIIGTIGLNTITKIVLLSRYGEY